jgi:hypothetical protein
MNNPDHISESLETIFSIPRSGMEKIRIRDPGSATLVRTNAYDIPHGYGTGSRGTFDRSRSLCYESKRFVRKNVLLSGNRGDIYGCENPS